LDRSVGVLTGLLFWLGQVEENQQIVRFQNLENKSREKGKTTRSAEYLPILLGSILVERGKNYQAS
jgi:hypothetical protein